MRGNGSFDTVHGSRGEKTVFFYVLPLPPPQPREEGRVQRKDSDWSWQQHSHFLMTLLSEGAGVSCESGTLLHAAE